MDKWMENSCLKNKKVSKLLLPGTHDSGAYQVDAPYFIGHFVNKWTITQNLNIYQQLMSGVRSFDLRITLEKNKFYVSHRFLCDSLETIMLQILNFIGKNQNEVILLHINTDNNNNSMTSKNNDLMNFLFMHIGNYIVENTTNYTELILGDIINSSKRIIIFSDYLINVGKTYVFNDINHLWYNQTDEYQLIQKFKDDDVYSPSVFDFVLTPNLNYVLSNMNGSIKNMAKKVNKELETILQDRQISKVNVITLDYIDVNNVSKIIEYNIV